MGRSSYDNKALTLTEYDITTGGKNVFKVYDDGGGLFKRGAVTDEYYYGAASRQNEGMLGFSLPSSHGQDDDQNAPLGGGVLLLMGFSAAYAGLRRKNQK